LIGAIAVIIAIFSVLGHICALPLHAHAVPVEGHGSHDDDTADHSVHTASCDALKSGRPVLSAPPVVAVVPLMTPVPSVDASLDQRPADARAESPPLFLLHAAFLI
jgi:hypothetical protein